MRAASVICVSACLLLAASTAASADIDPGSYAAKAKGVSVKLEVGRSGGGSLAYSTKSRCGKSKGKIALSKAGAGLKGRRMSRGPEKTLRTTVAKVALSQGGDHVVGTIKESLRGGNSKLAGCRAKRSFSASVDSSEGFVATRDAGHYEGTGQNGMPISFDVVESGGQAWVENLAVDVTADCYDESDLDASDVSLVTHVAGMEGQVDDDGVFYIEYAPDDDTEYEFDGELAAGHADIDVIIGGLFDDAGIPSLSGPYFCDSWGDLYEASQQ